MIEVNISETDLNKIIKKTLSFMARNKITITPDNYEKWFSIFIDLFIKGEEIDKISPLELLGIYKEKYSVDPFDEIKKEKELLVGEEKIPLKIVKDVLNDVDNSIMNILGAMEEHCSLINEGKQILEEADDKKILLKALASITDRYEDLKEDIKKQHQKIEDLKREIEITKCEAEKDFLTGVYNRRKFDKMLDDLTGNGKHFVLMLIDLDNFKQINDTYGHQAGDMILKKVGETLKKNLRPETPIFRIGGEEFAIILPNVHIKDGETVAERLRKIFELKEIFYENKLIPLSATFGLTSYHEGDTPLSICQRADEALYKGKKMGKNIVVVA